MDDVGKSVADSSGVVGDGDDFFVIDTVQCEESSNNSAYLVSEEGYFLKLLFSSFGRFFCHQVTYIAKNWLRNKFFTCIF